MTRTPDTPDTAQNANIACNEYRVFVPIDFSEYHAPEMRDNAQIDLTSLIADLVMLRDHRTVPAGHWERTIDAAITALRALGGGNDA
jgi:hypothetical protein